MHYDSKIQINFKIKLKVNLKLKFKVDENSCILLVIT
jgi:hypothetical protein